MGVTHSRRSQRRPRRRLGGWSAVDRELLFGIAIAVAAFAAFAFLLILNADPGSPP